VIAIATVLDFALLYMVMRRGVLKTLGFAVLANIVSFGVGIAIDEWILSGMGPVH